MSCGPLILQHCVGVAATVAFSAISSTSLLVRQWFKVMITFYGITRVEVPNLAARLFQPEYAEYVHTLRTELVYSHDLSEVRRSMNEQRRWIEADRAGYLAILEVKHAA